MPTAHSCSRLICSLSLLAVLMGIAGLGLSTTRAQIPGKAVNQPCTACEPFTVQTADLDGDDDRDVLSASTDDGKIAWHENLGGGQFSPQKVITSDHTTAPSSVDLSDLDGDGDVDVFSDADGADDFEDENTFVWYENDGTGSFSDRDTIRVLDGFVGAARAVDLNNDEKGDIFAEVSGNLVWYRNAESGFADPDTVRADFQGSFPRLSDLNGDEYKDLLRGSSSSIIWAENLDGEGFAAPDTLTSSLDNVVGLTSTDLDSDGDQDLLFVNLIRGFGDNEYEVSWIENQDSGGFSDPTVITNALNFFGGTLAAADLEGDGDKDIVVGSIDPKKLSWLQNDGSESFSSPTTITTGPNREASTGLSLHLANLDGDDDTDVLSASSAADRIAWYESRVDQGEGVVPQGAINALPDLQAPESLYPTDLDGDDDTDVLASSSRDEKIVWYENLDDSGFAQDTISTTTPFPTMVRAADLDGDDDTDVLTASVTSTRDENVVWYENLDGGGFSKNVIAAGGSARMVHTADLDSDGDLDILSAGDKIVWFENLDSGGFSSMNEIGTTSQGALSLDTADLDGDGDPEVLAGVDQGLENVIAWYENLDDGGFSSANEISADRPVSLDTEDLDGDGDLDILAAERSSDDEINWYENLDDSTFSDDNVITNEVSRANSVHAADLAGDGNVDVLSASSSDSKIAWYNNPGDGRFSDQKLVSDQALGAQDVYAVDLDGDGDSDVLSASQQDDKIAWYENVPGVLPVDLAGLSAQTDGSSAVLTWTTASETNNAGFAIQHRPVDAGDPSVKPSQRDGSTESAGSSEAGWTKIGFKNGAGTTSETQSYRFTAENLSVGTHQFRLKQVDLDGSMHVSKTVTVELGLDRPARLTAPAPNPVTDRATLSFAVKEAQETTIRLYDVLGRQVATLYRGTPTAGEAQTVDLSATDLSSGVYFLRLQTGERTKTRRLTVVK